MITENKKADDLVVGDVVLRAWNTDPEVVNIIRVWLPSPNWFPHLKAGEDGLQIIPMTVTKVNRSGKRVWVELNHEEMAFLDKDDFVVTTKEGDKQ